jgi:Zn-dependent protease with chaperone function
VGIIIHFVAGLGLMFILNWTGLIPWRRAASAHWTERARLLWPMRVTAGWALVFVPILVGLIYFLFFPVVRPIQISEAVAAFFGALLGNYAAASEIYPQINFKLWCHQTIANGMRFIIWGLLIGAIFLMPDEFGWDMLPIAVGYLVLQLAVQFGLALRYLRWVNFLKPASERLRMIVEETSRRLNTPPPPVEQLDGVSANAFAIVTGRRLIFSDRLVEICTDNEISAICAHELAHLSESKMVLAGRLLGLFSFFPLVFIVPCMKTFGFAGLLGPYLVMFLIARFSRSLSQKMERRADQIATTDQAHDRVYAEALEKLYRFNQIPAVNATNRQTHPHLYDRLVDAGVLPDFPRPEKPDYFTWPGYIFMIAIVVLLVFVEIRIFNPDMGIQPQ